MANLTRGEPKEAFRTFVEEAIQDPMLRQRAWQLLEAIVFTQEPILRGVEYFEVREGSGAPTIADYEKDGFGTWIDSDTGEVYVVLRWEGGFYIVGGSGTGSLPDFDYAYVSSKDAATDIVGAELEELSDGSDTTLHNHDGYYYTEGEIDTELLLYALVDGSRAFTGNVEIETPANPELRLDPSGAGTEYTVLTNVTGSAFLDRVSASDCAMFMNPKPAGGSASATVGVFRTTNTNGPCEFRIHYGNNTSDINNSFRGVGDTNLCISTGQVTIGGTGGAKQLTVIGDGSFSDDLFLTLSTTEPADGELANGEMVLWYQAT